MSELLNRARWVLGMTVHPDTAEVMPAAMSHVKASEFAREAREVLEAVCEELELLRDVEEAARDLPRRTPAVGGASTEHSYKLAAWKVWSNDMALKALDRFRSGCKEGPGPKA